MISSQVLTKKHILIVTYNWPPRNAIGTHRPYSWAKHFSETGIRVTVLTSRKHDFDSPLDLDLPLIANIKVVEVPYLQTTLRQSYTGKINKMIRFLKRALSRTRHLLPFDVDIRNQWRYNCYPLLESIARDADAVISTYGPAASHLIANDIKRLKPSILWIADYRDLWSFNPTRSANKLRTFFERRSEGSIVMKNADKITVVSSDMSEVIASRFNRESFVIANGFDEEEQFVRDRLTSASRKSIPGHFRFVYTGTVYKDSRNPAPLLFALAQLKSKGKLANVVTVDFYGSRLEPVNELNKNPLLKPFIRIMGHATRSECLKAQREANALLLMESSDINARGVLTGKVFEYIVSGTPILCIGSDPEYEIGHLLGITRTGLVYGPKQVNGLSQLIMDTIDGRGLYDTYRPDLDEIIKYSRKRLAEKMLSLVES